VTDIFCTCAPIASSDGHTLRTIDMSNGVSEPSEETENSSIRMIMAKIWSLRLGTVRSEIYGFAENAKHHNIQYHLAFPQSRSESCGMSIGIHVSPSTLLHKTPAEKRNV
jgi:hypothetical protein